MQKFLKSILRFILDQTTLDVSDIVLALKAVEDQIDRTINKSHRQLTDLNDQREMLARTITEKNAELDKAYKLLHNITNLTK